MRVAQLLCNIKLGKLTSEEIRIEFEKNIGTEKYIQFVLTLYEEFPLRDKLLFWQEQLLNDYCSEHEIEPITFENVWRIFNHCPVHHYKLKNDIVPIIDGNKIVPNERYKMTRNLFPMANINAPRDIERFHYPKNVDVFYCEICREIIKNE